MYTLLLLSCLVIETTYAWGFLGHFTVAFIAQNYVSDTTKHWAQELLEDKSDSYLANWATWADSFSHSSNGRFSRFYHYIDSEDFVETPPVACAVHFPADCSNDGCIISAIANYTERVRNRGIVPLPAGEQQIALKMLIHLLGDITQPLHTENYKVGGTQMDVLWKGHVPDSKFHHVWDSDMAEELRGDANHENAKAWADDITHEIDNGIYSSLRACWLSVVAIEDAENSAIKMARDTNRLMCEVVLPDGAEALEGQELFPEYYEKAIDTVELQVAKAGYRLASWLNAVAPNGRETDIHVLETQPHPELRRQI